MRDRTKVLLIAFGVLVADQVTKAMVTAWIPFNARIPLIDGLLALTRVHNNGAAFGLFADAPPGPLRVALIVVSVLAVGLIWAYAREGWHEPRIVAAFGLILGGAIGNLADRLRLHYVVDFVDVHWGDYHWPSFNVADAAITVGALTLFIAMARHGEADDPTGAALPDSASRRLANLSTHERSGAEESAAEDAARLS
jgi:signal peptidase II